MARKLKAGMEASEDPKPKKRGRPKNAAPPPSSNVTDATIAEFCNKALTAHGEFETARDEMKQKQGAYRAVLKDARKAGVETDSITWWIAARKREPGDIDRETRSRNRVAKLMNLPIGTQLGLFDDGKTVATTIEDEQRESGVEKLPDDAYNEGLLAGKDGKPITVNPYPLESAAFDQFEKGWGAGQYANIQAMSNGAGAHA